MSASDESSTVAQVAEQHEGTNVEKIRDILFGSQMRDYEKRFQRLEERLTKDAEALREELKKRFDGLETSRQRIRDGNEPALFRQVERQRNPNEIPRLVRRRRCAPSFLDVWRIRALDQEARV